MHPFDQSCQGFGFPSYDSSFLQIRFWTPVLGCLILISGFSRLLMYIRLASTSLCCGIGSCSFWIALSETLIFLSLIAVISFSLCFCYDSAFHHFDSASPGCDSAFPCNCTAHGCGSFDLSSCAGMSAQDYFHAGTTFHLCCPNGD